MNLVLFSLPFILLFFTVNHGISSLVKQQIYNRLFDTVEENIKTINLFLVDREIDLKSYAKLDIEEIEEVFFFFQRFILYLPLRI
ncbi:MAG: hypothetical protein U9O50_04695 [Acidobacteriota bacterium]|nr:hypothetical protein [Acidobacteriota bacterium]